jgi:hypothetical protein
LATNALCARTLFGNSLLLFTQMRNLHLRGSTPHSAHPRLPSASSVGVGRHRGSTWVWQLPHTRKLFFKRRRATARSREVLGRDSWHKPFRRPAVMAPGAWTPVLGLAAAHVALGRWLLLLPRGGALVGRSRERMSQPRISHPSCGTACRRCCCPCLLPGPGEGCCSDRACPPG